MKFNGALRAATAGGDSGGGRWKAIAPAHAKVAGHGRPKQFRFLKEATTDV